MHRIVNLLLQLIKSAVDDTEIDKNIAISDEDAKKLYVLSKKHDMAHLVSYALDKNGICLTNKEAAEKFKKQQMLAVFRYERQNYDFEQLCNTFNEAKIPFIPLKGAVIRNMYPEPWMRTSCDIDILINEADLVKAKEAVTDMLGYTLGGLGNHDIEFMSPGGVHFELHFSLLNDRNEDKYLKNIWKYAYIKSNSKFEYKLSDEIFYYYHIYHMSKHFLNGGCGIKPFLDIWFFNRNNLSVEKFGNGVLSQSKMYCFAKHSETMADVWFGDSVHTELTEKMQSFILGGGVYGSAENKASMHKHRSKSKVQYFMSRIWLPESVMKLHYPELNEKPQMLLFYQIKRWFKILFSTTDNNKPDKDMILRCESNELAKDLIKSLKL